MIRLLLACVFVLLAAQAHGAGRPAEALQVAIGSKAFTESVVLGEMLARLASSAGARATHRAQMGGTRIAWNALLAGEIDAYPEYTGTLAHEILADRPLGSMADLRATLAGFGLGMSASLGFDNSYALGMRAERAAALGVSTISGLAAYPKLSLGFSNEFLDRGDGWRGLKAQYGLPHEDVRGLAHDLAYRGLASGSLDVIDVYTTDAEISYYDLLALEDDRNYFPAYEAVVLYRLDLEARAPAVVQAIRRLEGALDAVTMSRLNAAVKIDGQGEGRVAAQFLQAELGVSSSVAGDGLLDRLLARTLEHLALVGLSLSAAILAAIPLGIAAYAAPRAGRLILAGVGILQTIPSLALFVFMIPLLGIGGPPAVVALFLYSLLPIVQNTHAGLSDVPGPIRESAIALGLPAAARLRIVELPLATRSIVAGIKTSAVINVGTATLAALIGAGGYGQPILTGIRLADTGLILEGAVPAALLALGVQAGFGLLERALLPPPAR